MHVTSLHKQLDIGLNQNNAPSSLVITDQLIKVIIDSVEHW